MAMCDCGREGGTGLRVSGRSGEWLFTIFI